MGYLSGGQYHAPLNISDNSHGLAKGIVALLTITFTLLFSHGFWHISVCYMLCINKSLLIMFKSRVVS